jgi:hypothetical protein
MLSRGQYRVRLVMPRVSEEAASRAAQLVQIPVDNELKRVQLYKVDSVPSDGPNGEEYSTVTAIFRVIDNPLPLVGLIPFLVYGGGAWLLIDKVESFGESGIGKLLTIMAAAVTVFVFLRDK